MKKPLLLLFCLLIVLPALAYDFTYTYQRQTLTYTLLSEEDKTVCIKAGTTTTPGNNVSGVLFIPSKVSDGECTYTVTQIGNYAFSGCSSLTSI